MAKMDQDGSGTVSYTEFLRYFGKGGAADTVLTQKVTGVSVAKAKQMIRDKIESRHG